MDKLVLTLEADETNEVARELIELAIFVRRMGTRVRADNFASVSLGDMGLIAPRFIKGLSTEEPTEVDGEMTVPLADIGLKPEMIEGRPMTHEEARELVPVSEDKWRKKYGFLPTKGKAVSEVAYLDVLGALSQADSVQMMLSFAKLDRDPEKVKWQATDEGHIYAEDDLGNILFMAGDLVGGDVPTEYVSKGIPNRRVPQISPVDVSHLIRPEVEKPKREQLNKRDQTIIDMYTEGFAVKEIQEAIGKSSGHIYTVLNATGTPKRKSGGVSKVEREMQHIMDDPEKLSGIITDYQSYVPLDVIYERYGLYKNGLYYLLDKLGVERQSKRR